MAGQIFLKPLFTEIEKNNCFSIYARSDLSKIGGETTEKYDLIDRSGQLDTRKKKIDLCRIFKHGNSKAHHENNSVIT